MHSTVDSLKAFLAGTGRDLPQGGCPHAIVLGAGKGGVGTSALAGLLAIHAGARGMSVLLVDADETVGALHYMFGIPGEVPGLGALRSAAVSPHDLVLHVAPGVTLFPGGGGGAESTLAVASAERRMLLRRVAGLYDRFDLVVVDGGSRLDSVMAACAAGAGRLMGVTTPDRIAQAAVYALVKVARGRFPALAAELVVNRAEEAAGREVHEIVHTATSSFLGARLTYGGAVPSDPELDLLVGAGGSLLDLAKDAPAATGIAPIADRLAAEAHARVAYTAPVIPLRRGF
ncbi:MAG: MinD/ParA family protein [Gemmatimonadetes bacterium]|nr:MinD/ParA family protein [Gemmatimonadota bacterium]